jgi:hypothetical protein
LVVDHIPVFTVPIQTTWTDIVNVSYFPGRTLFTQ